MTAKILTFPGGHPVPAEAIHERRKIIIHDCAKAHRIWPVRDGERCRWCGEIVTQFNQRGPDGAA